MGYQHIVIAVDLNEDNQCLLEKGAALAGAYNAKLSLIHVDIHHAPCYSALGLQTYHYIGEVPNDVKTKKQLAELALRSSYPTPDSIVITGELIPELSRNSTSCNFQGDHSVSGCDSQEGLGKLSAVEVGNDFFIDLLPFD